MKNLRVGMRVRILWSSWWPELSGKEGVIIRRADNEPAGSDPRCEWIVAPDCWGSELSPCKNHRFGPKSDQLEPLYDGNETVTWESCAWKPEWVTT